MPGGAGGGRPRGLPLSQFLSFRDSGFARDTCLTESAGIAIKTVVLNNIPFTGLMNVFNADNLIVAPLA